MLNTHLIGDAPLRKKREIAVWLFILAYAFSFALAVYHRAAVNDWLAAQLPL